MMHRPDRGSTLIELLISLTILGVILLIIMGAFRIGIRAWETGDRDVDTAQRQQIAFSILKRQLSSAVNQPIVLEDEKSFVFRGYAESMDFISTIPVVPGNEAGNVQVGYRIGVEDDGNGYYLEITEQNLFVQNGGKKKMGSAKEPSAYRLLSGAQGMSFSYLKITPEASEWQAEWNPEKDTGFPVAVRCIVQMEAEKAPITVIARMLQETESR